MCYQRVKARLCRVRALLAWFIPTRRQRWALGLLFLAFLIVTGRTERRRREELLKATAAQTIQLESRLRQEVETAVETHQTLQAEIDALRWQVAQLERKQKEQ